MNLLDNSEVSTDLPFLDIPISAAKWEVEHLTEKVKSFDVIHLGRIPLAKTWKKEHEK